MMLKKLPYIFYFISFVCFSQTQTPFVNVTFQVDLSNQEVSSSGIHLAGSFQEWNTSSMQMIDVDGDMIFSITIPVESNQSYEYKFINGVQWDQAEIIQGICASNNRSLNTSFQDTILEPVCFNLCGVCPDYEAIPEGIIEGLNVISDSSVIFSLFAPHKNYVHLLGDFNDWEMNHNSMMKKDLFTNQFWIQLDGLDPNLEYRYQFSIDLNSMRIADIYSDKILDETNDVWIPQNNWVNHPNYIPYPDGETTGHVSCFTINKTDYSWEIESFSKPQKEKLIIYELLVRDFLESQSYNDLIDSLDYLDNIGVNAIELMPVNEFEGNNSWGYNPSFYFASDKNYGSNYDLKHFIDECHERGIAVIMDIALNHSYSQNPQVQMYFDPSAGEWGQPSSDSPWFNSSPKHDFNVGYDYNHESAHTKYFCKRVFKYWVEEFKIDGFRLDLSKGYTQNHSLGSLSQWNTYDQGRINILKEYANHIWSTHPDTYIILEHFADNSEETELANFGFMLWGNMHHEYSEASMGYGGDFTSALYSNRGWASPHLISYMESHDEERCMYKNLNYGNFNETYDIRNFDIALDRIKLAYTFMMLVPGPKMLWQFGELGYDYPINLCEDGFSVSESCRTSPKPSAWSFHQDSLRMELYNLVSEINYLKRKIDVFSSQNFTYDLSGDIKRITFSTDQENATIIGNFGLTEGSILPHFQHTGLWFDYLSETTIIEENLDNYFLLSPGEYRIYTDFQVQKIIDVTFQVNMLNEEPSSNGVYIAGSFQNWEPGNILMNDENDDGIYSVTLSLEANSSYQYKFINGNEWGVDETVFGDCGEGNRVLNTLESDTIIDPVCFNSCNNCSDISQITQLEQTVYFPEGWSMFSFFVEPNNKYIDSILAPLTEDIIIVKDYHGNVFLPNLNFNAIGQLKNCEGYQIKMSNDNSLTINGYFQILDDQPIELPLGWFIMGYLKINPTPFNVLLSEIEEAVIIVKDYNGNAYLPDWDFNAIGDAVPGQGYQIKTNSSAVLW